MNAWFALYMFARLLVWLWSGLLAVGFALYAAFSGAPGWLALAWFGVMGICILALRFDERTLARLSR